MSCWHHRIQHGITDHILTSQNTSWHHRHHADITEYTMASQTRCWHHIIYHGITERTTVSTHSDRKACIKESKNIPNTTGHSDTMDYATPQCVLWSQDVFTDTLTCLLHVRACSSIHWYSLYCKDVLMNWCVLWHLDVRAAPVLCLLYVCVCCAACIILLTCATSYAYARCVLNVSTYSEHTLCICVSFLEINILMDNNSLLRN